KTILFVSHDIDEAVKMGDKIALLRDGRIMQYDEPTELLFRPKNEFVSDFIGKDRALKSMSLYTVHDLVKAFNLHASVESSKNTKEVSVDMSISIDLSMLLNQEADQLMIVDSNNKAHGALTIDLIEKFLHQEVKGA